MTILLFTLFLFFIASLAGLVGSLTGLGGGVVIIPLLTLVFKVDIHYAIGTSLISVIATSSGSAAAYVKEGITNIRIGMFLEIATTAGAFTGAILAIYVSVKFIAVLFGTILIFSAIMSLREKKEHITGAKSFLSRRLRLDSSYPVEGEMVEYGV